MVTIRKTYFELVAPGLDAGGQPCCRHWLIELEHPKAIDARLCWLQASVMAQEVLGRLPLDLELREVGRALASKLRRAASPAFLSHGRAFAVSP